jgi:hypothetical protein
MRETHMAISSNVDAIIHGSFPNRVKTDNSEGESEGT